MLRSVAEKLSRNVILKRMLHTDKGPRKLLVSPEASLKYWIPNSLNSDRVLHSFVRKHVTRGARVWDIGANVGVFTFLSAAAATDAGKVLAIEADAFMSTLLLRSTAHTPADDATPAVITAAVSDSISTAEFSVPERSRASGFLSATGGCSQTGGTRCSYTVLCITLDWLLEQFFPPSVVKMDIEGMEYRALRASPRLICEIRPILHLEVWDSISDDLTHLLRGHDYALFDGEKSGQQKPLERASWCTLAIPRESL
ncbi:MAG: FkbM family methyltransferase [Planctomycetes bacterium]|nr:FkbM family methyltransferase [Planctomycetota bacterium]